MEIKDKTFAAVYGELLNQLMHNAEYESCPRGQKTKEIMDITLEIEDPTQCLYLNNKRSSQFKYIAAELVWYFSGDRSLEYIKRYASFWENIAHVDISFDEKNDKDLINIKNESIDNNELFSNVIKNISSDFNQNSINALNHYSNQINILKKKYLDLLDEKIKEHFNKNAVVNSAYGDLIFRKKNEHDYSQYHWAFDSLVKDKDSRQAIMHFNLPEHQYEGNKDFVCTLSGMFYIRENKLYLTINMRSNDAILGTPTDVAFFCTLQRHMLYHLKPFYPELELGSYKHKVHSMHVYERHFELIEKMLNEKVFEPVTMPSINKPLINFDGSPTDIIKSLFEWASQDIREEIVIGQDQFINFITKNLINEKN